MSYPRFQYPTLNVHQQAILAVNVNQLGMSLLRMDNIEDKVRFLDDVDMTLSLDSRTTSSQQTASIEIASQPIVFRASYRDINLITSIVSKATELYGKAISEDAPAATSASGSRATRRKISSKSHLSSKATRSQSISADNAQVVISKEQVPVTLGQRTLRVNDFL